MVKFRNWSTSKSLRARYALICSGPAHSNTWVLPVSIEKKARFTWRSSLSILIETIQTNIEPVDFAGHVAVGIVNNLVDEKGNIFGAA